MTCRKTTPLLLLSLPLGCSTLHGQPMSLSACMDYAVGHATEMRLSAADRSDERAEKVQAILGAFTPKRYITSPYIFAHCGDFFAYPNNYNQYVQYYMNTFQHGGISMEEILIPFITLKPKA